MKLLSRRSLALLSTTIATAAALLAPSSASAILAGAESNRELVNSNLTPAKQAQALTKMQRQGVQVVRGNFGWNEVAVGPCAGQGAAALENPDNACYNWTLLDSLVTQANARKIDVLISLTRVPAWVIGGEPKDMGRTPAQFRTVLAHYAAFHKAAATRYRTGSPHGTIRYWTVHNEPNSADYWGPWPNAARYAQLYARTAMAIKAAHPRALVAPGPTNPSANNGIKPVKFIRDFQRHALRYLPGSVAAKRRYINAWAHNPYPGYNTQPHVPFRFAHPQSIGMANIDRLFRQLDASPLTRGTRVWATEFGWETVGSLRVSEPVQAQLIAEAFAWLHSKRRVTIGISYGLSDPIEPGDWQSGTFTHWGRPKLSMKMFQRMVAVPEAGLSSRVGRARPVRIWGKSNVNPSTGILAYSVVGRACAPGKAWCAVPGQRRDRAGAIKASMRLPRATVRFAVWSRGNPAAGVPDGYGLYRQVSAR